MYFIVSYDISDDDKRKSVADFLEDNKAKPVLRSQWVIRRPSDREAARLLRKIRSMVDDSDRILVNYLSPDKYAEHNLETSISSLVGIRRRRIAKLMEDIESLLGEDEREDCDE